MGLGVMVVIGLGLIGGGLGVRGGKMFEGVVGSIRG